MVSGSILILAFMLFWKQILNILPHLYDGLSRTSPWRYLIQSRFKPVIWKQCIRSPFRTAIHRPFFITMTTGEQYWAGLTYFCLRFNTTRENLPFQTKYINRFLAHSAFSPNSKLPRTWGGSPGKAYLWLGGGQSEPYSWTCMPKKHKSTPSISSKAKRALVRYGKDSAISPLSTNLCNSDWREKRHLVQIRIITSNHAWTAVDPWERRGDITTYLAFMPGLTSTVLSEAWTTRTVTSPDSGWFCRLRNSFTRFSRKVPSLVDGNPRNAEVKSSVVTKVQIYYYQSQSSTSNT